uniref:Unclassified n=1 Tax=Fusarium clavum TaxID=2594811 RepID=W1IBX0_9HYPO|nr:unclassified [Fusarium clavum]CEF82621.1 unclassified [Fusarium clavum]
MRLGGICRHKKAQKLRDEVKREEKVKRAKIPPWQSAIPRDRDDTGQRRRGDLIREPIDRPNLL